MAFNNFPYTDLQDLNIDWLLRKMKEVDQRSAEALAAATNAEEVAKALREFVNNYFDNLDVQEEINNKIDAMLRNGDFDSVVGQFVPPLVPPVVTEWMDNNMTPTAPPVDASLSIPGAAADAFKTGQLKNDLYNFNAVDLIPTRTQHTSHGVTLTPTGTGSYNLDGTATATTAISLYNSDSFPEGIEAGKSYDLKTLIPVSGVRVRFYAYVGGTVETTPFYDSSTSTDSEVLTIPEGSNGLNVAIYIPNGTAFNNHTMYVRLLNTKSNQHLAEKIAEMNLLNPDDYSGGDTNRIQRCINKIVESGGNGVIFINRKYHLTSNVVCTLNTDNDNAYRDKSFITFLGVGENAGFEFASSAVSFTGEESGSPYGGLRFININFAQHENGIGYGSTFTRMQGLIRMMFINCRFNGFGRVFDTQDAGSADTKIVQNLLCFGCYFSDCRDYVLDAYTLGDTRRAPYLYEVYFKSCIVEKCGGLVKGSASSGYSVWSGVRIEDCTIEGCTNIPIVFGVGTRSVSIVNCYFEKNDYNRTHAHIDMRNLFGTNPDAIASVLGVEISGNVFVKGRSTEDYAAQSVAILAPSYEPWEGTEAPDLMHGVISNNVVEDTFIQIGNIPANRMRFKIENNGGNIVYNHDAFYDYANRYTSVRPTSPEPGYCMFDSSLNKPIWFNGNRWVDSSGNNV